MDAQTLRDWQIKIKDGEEAIFDFGDGVKIRARMAQGQVYINAFPGALSVVPDSGNSVYLSVVPLSYDMRHHMGKGKT